MHGGGMKNKAGYLIPVIMLFVLVSRAPKTSGDVELHTFPQEVSEDEELHTLPRETEEASNVSEDGEASVVISTDAESLEIETLEQTLPEWGLDYVEKPQKRSRQEAIAKIEELSVQFSQLSFVVKNEALYPDGLLTSVANNPEMADYVCGYPDADGSVTGGFTKEELEQEYPLFLQFDSRWGYYPYGITVMGDSGCGPTCLSMAVFYLTRDATVTPNVVGQYSMDNGYYVTDVGTAWALLEDYPAIHGLSSTTLSVNEEAMKQKLEEGNVLICSMRPGNFTAGGHFVVVYGVDEEGYKVNDPKCVYRSKKSWSYEELAGDIKRIWCVGR